MTTEFSATGFQQEIVATREGALALFPIETYLRWIIIRQHFRGPGGHYFSESLQKLIDITCSHAYGGGCS